MPERRTCLLYTSTEIIVNGGGVAMDAGVARFLEPHVFVAVSYTHLWAAQAYQMP